MSKKSIGTQGHAGLLALRIGVGILFIIHGYGKIVGGPGTWADLGQAMTYVGITFLPTFFGFMASISEFLGGILLIAGLFTRVAATFMLITMLVAVAKHAGAGESFYHPLTNVFIFLAFTLTGPGRYSVDRRLRNKR